MKRGYIGQIGNEFVFMVAKNIDNAKTKFIENANGKKWEFDSTRQFKVIK
mgnify:CR=1 FL=1